MGVRGHVKRGDKYMKYMVVCPLIVPFCLCSFFQCFYEIVWYFECVLSSQGAFHTYMYILFFFCVFV